MIRRNCLRAAVVVLVVSTLGGCASLVPSTASKRDVTAKRESLFPWEKASKSATTAKRDAATKREAVAKREASHNPRERRDEAIREFEIKRNQAQYEAAISRWHENDVAGCRQNLTQLLARDPNHLEACLLWAELALDQQNAEEALEKLLPCAAQYPKEARVQHTLGLVWEAKGRQAEALVCFERAVKLAPGEEIFRVSYETAAAGVSVPTSEPSGDQGDVIVSDDAPAHGPAKPAKQTIKQAANSSKLVSGADESVELVIKRLTIDTAAITSQLATRELLRKANQALVAEDSTQAALWYERAMACEPTNVQIAVQAALQALAHDQPDLAIALASGQVEQFPRSAPLQLVLGVAYYRQANFNSAQSALQQALSLDKRSSLSYFLMGSTLKQLGKPKAAAAQFARAAELDATLVRR